MSMVLSLSVTLLNMSVVPPGNGFASFPPYIQAQWLSERTCPNDAFVVESPLWALPFPTSFAGGLASRMETALDTQWFCGPKESCSRSDFSVRVTPVLADYSNAAAFPNVLARRRDGHRRFLRVDFLRRQSLGWARVGVRSGRACSVVATLRAEAYAQVGLAQPSCSGSCPQPSILVARECLTGAQDVEAWLDPSTTDWAYQRVATPGVGRGPVEVALLDAGVPPNLRAALGVVSESTPPAALLPSTGEYHAHGAHMAAIIRRVAPDAVISSHRALDGNGTGGIGALARALDNALFPSPQLYTPRAPLVVNVSMGFLPHLTRPSRLSGDACSTREDGLGESVRYMVDLAAQLDASGAPVLINAAGGNAILEQTEPFNAVGDATATTPCGTDAAVWGPAAFFPAELQSHTSCRRYTLSFYGTTYTFYAQQAAPVLAVGASDYRDFPSSLTMRGAEPYVYAPGERVYATSLGLAAPDPFVACGPSEVGRARAFEFPAAVSGTSASAAMVSGAVARALGMAPTREPGVPWQGAALARLVHLTGVRMCRTVKDRRRLDIERLEHAVTGQLCMALRECVASTAHPQVPIVGYQTPALCDAQLTSCFSGVPAPDEPGCWAEPPLEPAWPAGYVSSLYGNPACATKIGVPAGPNVPVCTSGRCIYDQVSLSGVKPQPGEGACPNCKFSFNIASGVAQVRGEINDAFLPGTVIRNAYLVLLDEDKSMALIPLGPYELLPGEAFEISTAMGLATADVLDLFNRGGAAAIDVEVVDPDGVSARDVSALAYELW
ncbi:MAG: S8/S53 family peptidase [Myxococcales bacterium]|nr:S8/S53 family peptidase [Myxococcales bacterium]